MVDIGFHELPESSALSAPESYRTETALVMVVSVLLHTGLALGLRSRDASAATAPRPVSKVEVQLTRPPPPRPPPPREEPPPAPALAPPSKVRSVVPRPVTNAPPAPSFLPQRDDVGIDAPEGPDGTEPPGSGEIGTAPPPVVAPPPPPAAPPPPPPPVVEAKEGANYLKNPRPAYPAIALRQGWEGQVLLRVQVLPSGRPGAVSVEKSSGRHVLDEAAIDAVKGWTFVPATQGGRPIGGSAVVPIVFRIQ